MRFAIVISSAALVLALSGCQSAPIGAGVLEGETGAGYAGGLGGVGYGHGESGIVDYRQVLSNPGPFE